MRLRHIIGSSMLPGLRIKEALCSNSRGAVKVLAYHGISDKEITMFGRQIDWLARRYPFIDPYSFHDFLDGRLPLREKHILITFDDGFISARRVTERVLEPLGIKALFFIPTGFLELREGADWREYVARNMFAGRIKSEEVPEWQSPMDKDDLVWLRSRGHAIGAHTVSHCKLSQIKNHELLEEEIAAPLIHLTQTLGEEITACAYPFGHVESINKEAFSIINNHYRYCYSTLRGENNRETPHLAIRREAVSLDDPPPYLGFLVEDGLGLYYRNKRKTLDEMVVAIPMENVSWPR